MAGLRAVSGSGPRIELGAQPPGALPLPTLTAPSAASNPSAQAIAVSVATSRCRLGNIDHDAGSGPLTLVLDRSTVARSA